MTDLKNWAHLSARDGRLSSCPRICLAKMSLSSLKVRTSSLRSFSLVFSLKETRLRSKFSRDLRFCTMNWMSVDDMMAEGSQGPNGLFPLSLCPSPRVLLAFFVHNFKLFPMIFPMIFPGPREIARGRSSSSTWRGKQIDSAVHRPGTGPSRRGGRVDKAVRARGFRIGKRRESGAQCGWYAVAM